MLRKILRCFLTLLGIVLGSEATYLIIKYFKVDLLLGYELTGIRHILIIALFGVIGGIIFYFISPRIITKGSQAAIHIEKMLQKVPTNEIIIGALGLIMGLVIANLISGPLKLIPYSWLAGAISVLLYILMGYLGISVATKKREDLINAFSILKRIGLKDKDKSKSEHKVQPKVLDTSVIIDGRIADIVKTGFVEGPLVIPTFVLEELRHIADSSDGLKRNRGRRGLDILNKIQNDMDIIVEIIEKDFDDVSEVDTKLLKLAQFLDGKVVTNDYNLNKVAEFQRVPVLNINELANAVKPVVLPGEEMEVTVIKDGKESGQGIAYLDDGTMIVVENGRRNIGDTITVVVTSVLQTAAGRMIFAKLKSAAEKVS
ncbi:MAG: PIN/TRAM domain-containing protein [Clostridiales bacterium]|nr:PIN/TRAM domain-containing protein [Clostridiales bacterium]